MSRTKVAIIYGGELAQDVAEQMKAKAPTTSSSHPLLVVDVTLINASERPKKVIEQGSNNDYSVLCFVMQTIENAQPTEEGGVTLRFYKRKTQPNDLLNNRKFAVLGIGDTNLLLDRQTTAAKDCNQVAQELDSRLEALGGTRCHQLGMADERTGLDNEVEPWIDSFWKTLIQQQQTE